jgi:methyl-galactoside transport system substrate-binding protein
MKKLLVLLLVLSFCISGLVSCGGGEDVSVFYYTYSDTYISSVRSSMNKLFKSSGINYHNYDANSNQTTQTEQIDTAISKGTKMLVVNVVDTGSNDAAKTIVEKAKAANIPLIFFNRSVDKSVIESYDKCVFVGTDYELAGHMQGELIGNYLTKYYNELDLNGDGKISYCLFKGQQGNAEAEARTKYAVEDANKILLANGKPKLYFYDSKNASGYLVDQDGNWSNAAANNHMKTILSAYSEANKNMVELIIANNDEMALGAISALNEAGYNKEGGKIIPVFGVDATEAAVALIESGRMSGTIKQDADGMAKAIAYLANNVKSDRDIMTGTENMNVDDNVSKIRIPYGIFTGKK